MAEARIQHDPAPMSNSDLTGKTVGRFLIRERLGGGGMGEVYLADDTGLKRQVALKRISPALRADAESRQRLWKEAEWASRLNDPHIAAVYDVIDDGGEVFVVMEYVEGETLRHRIGRPLSIAEFLSIATQCAAALAAAHKAGLLHRDIKPENIMLTRAGQVKALDFGVARELPGPDHATTRHTFESARFAGTLPYMAPEILEEKEGDGRSDIFSLGVVFYEALSGKNPFRRPGFLDTCNAILHQDPQPLSKQNSDVPEGIEKIVGKMLAKNREDRYATAADLDVDLRLLSRSAQLQHARSPGVPKKFLVLMTGVVLIAALGFLARNPRVQQRAKTLLGVAHVPRQKLLAILPFRALEGDVQTASFTDGLTATLTTKLTQLTDNHSLGVISASEIQAKQVTTADQAYAEFGVNLVLEGTLSQSGELLRINYDLVDPRTHQQLRGESFDLPASDPFAVQDRVVDGAVQMLELEVPPAERQVLDSHGTQIPAAETLYLQGRGYLQNYDRPENNDSAIQVFQQALKLDPKYALAYAGLGDAYWKKYADDKDPKWVQSSRESCEKAVSLDPNLAAAHECLGTLYSGRGQYENAVTEFESALKTEPTNDDAIRGLAKTYEQLGKLSEAEKTYQRAIDLRPQYWAGYNWLGAFYANHTRYADAAKMFGKVISLAPDSFRGYYNLAAVNVALGQYAEAIGNLNHSISIRPSSTAYANLGMAYFCLRRFDEAAQSFEQAVKLNDKFYEGWWDLGDAYSFVPAKSGLAKGAYAKCVSLANEAVNVDAKDSLAFSTRGICQAMLGERAAAFADLLRADTIAPGDPEVSFDTAVVYNHFGETDQALQWLEKAVSAGYSPSIARDYPFFDKMRSDPRFQKIFKSP
ncbi:MAG TPA: tetratricopeptide repeat protein [Candidatus Acidoferrales bacterium]|nr:tetratricopeptide repeat protein [Candidatus Acidoferrales bacterium]